MKIIYISIEFTKRELEPKLYFINEIKKISNFKFVVGQHDILLDSIFRGDLMPGFILLKSVQSYTKDKLKLLKKIGFKILYLEEESWVPFDDLDLLRRRTPQKSINLVDYILSPSSYFSGLLKTQFLPIYEIGHPRIDYIKSNCLFIERSCKFDFLIVSSFGFVNNINPKANFFSIMKNEIGLKEFREVEYLYSKYFSCVKKDFYSALTLYSELSELGFSVKYRPHPSEKIPQNVQLSNHNLTLLDDASSFQNIIHFGSTGAFDLITSGFENVYCYISKYSESILRNAKFLNKIFFNVDMLLSIIHNKQNDMRCISNIDYYYASLNFSELERLVNDLNEDLIVDKRNKFIHFIYFLYRLLFKLKIDKHKGDLITEFRSLNKKYDFQVLENKFLVLD